MTLHWWMHWFWITRTVAAATLLLFLLAAGTASPLPPSTLHPEFQNFASPSVTNLASVPPFAYQEKSSLLPSGRPEDTASFEANPVWSSSPEIEEPFYPTTAPHGGFSTEDFPRENQVISWPPDLYRTRVLPGGSSTSDSGNASTFRNSIDDKSVVFAVPSSLTRDVLSIDEMTEPRALPLKANSLVSIAADNKTISTINPDGREIAPKILRNDSSQVITEVTSKDVDGQSPFDNNLSSTNISVINTVNDTSDADSSRSKYSPRLIARDVRNLSESELTSHENSSASSQIPHNISSQTGLRPNIRTSKSIEFFPSQPVNLHPSLMHSSNPPSLTESEGRGDHLKNSGSVDGASDGKTLLDSTAFPGSSNGKTSVDKKTMAEDLEMSDSPYASTGHSNSTIFESQKHASISKHLPPSINNSSESATVDNKNSHFETGNSKLSSDNHTKVNVNTSDRSVNVSDITVSEEEHVSNKGKDMTPLASTLKPVNGSSPSKKQINGTHILNQNQSIGVSNEQGNFSVANESRSPSTHPGVIQVSAATNMTPASNRADFGRSASHNYAEDNDETTSTISVTPVSRVAASPSSSSRRGLDAASITGIALGIVVFAGLTGAISFVLYRRRYLNKPQTLNDKCSNPDSSGYIDDSTLRENSEEMYSLDNDSFLNSLEAMTIQNYWTDNVKHTKL